MKKSYYIQFHGTEQLRPGISLKSIVWIHLWLMMVMSTQLLSMNMMGVFSLAPLMVREDIVGFVFLLCISI